MNLSFEMVGSLCIIDSIWSSGYTSFKCKWWVNKNNILLFNFSQEFSMVYPIKKNKKYPSKLCHILYTIYYRSIIGISLNQSMFFPKIKNDLVSSCIQLSHKIFIFLCCAQLISIQTFIIDKDTITNNKNSKTLSLTSELFNKEIDLKSDW